VCWCFAGQGSVDFGGSVDFSVSPEPGWKCFGVSTSEMGLTGPVDGVKIHVVAQPHREASSAVHEDREEQNDRQRDADEPEQRAFSETHGRLPFDVSVEVKLVPAPFVPCGQISQATLFVDFPQLPLQQRYACQRRESCKARNV
jgi:hypothetical protein